MRLYHLLGSQHALDDIRKRRIKISLIPDLNDPFELHGIPLPTRKHRTVWRRFVRGVGNHSGVLCFTRKWDNPVLWSHYADKHRGVCLGFDVPSELSAGVRYRDAMLPFSLNLNHPSGGLGEDEMQEILFTKYSGWRYEDEMRVAVRLTDPEPVQDSTSPIFFASFGPELRLREVIVGVRSSLTKAEVEDALQSDLKNVDVIKARLAFKSFRVIRNKMGFGNS